MRYGFVEQAQRIAGALIEAAQAFGGRLPELFCGFDREDYSKPVQYPTSCSPQAWAAAAPVHLVRTLLHFQPSVPTGRLWVSPVLPRAFTPLRIEGVSLGDGRMSVDVSEEGTTLEGVLPGVKVYAEQVDATWD
jgi:glycogen debranching enzyme